MAITFQDFLLTYTSLARFPKKGMHAPDSTVFVLTFPNGTKNIVRANLDVACALMALSPIDTVFKMVTPHPFVPNVTCTYYAQRIVPESDPDTGRPTEFSTNWSSLDDVTAVERIAEFVARKSPQSKLNVSNTLGSRAVLRTL